MITRRAAQLEDAALIAPLLRKADTLEVLRMGVGSTESSIRRAIGLSDIAGIYFKGDIPLCVYGVVTASLIDAETGIPWLLGTPELDQCARLFLRQTREGVTTLLERYAVLTNWVDTDYVKAIRWLRWLGFSFDAPKPVGRNGALYQRFEIRREHGRFCGYGSHRG